MSISKTAATIAESVTLKLNERAATLRARGEPVIHLGAGEPKSKAPAAALEAAAKLLQTGEVRYTPADGIPALKDAIVSYTEEFYGRRVEPGNVMAAGGAKQAIMCCLQAILDPGDEVLFPAPYWVSYPEMVKLCGGHPVPVYAEDGGFEPKVREIKRKSGPRTKAIIINSPNNPSGVVYAEEFIRDIVRFCEDMSYYLIMDDIYQRLTFDSMRPANPYQYASNFGDDSRLVVVNGVSKQYAMTGFRIGWSVANRKLTQVMTNIQSHQTSGPSALSQAAAVGALTGPQSGVDELRLALQRNRDALMQGLRSFAGVKVKQPDGTFYCFVDFSAYDRNSTRLSNFLLDKARVLTVPGVEFGMDGYLRLSFCGSIEEITEGVRRIKWALDPDSPRELRIGDRVVQRDWK